MTDAELNAKKREAVELSARIKGLEPQSPAWIAMNEVIRRARLAVIKENQRRDAEKAAQAKPPQW
jgi:hypothetical protein